MPAVAVVGAVAAIAIAAEVGTTFAIIAAVGATVGAVGVVTGVKELQYAGAAIGAVGMIGGLASAAGLFGEAGSILSSASSAGAQMAGGGAEAAQAASAAAELSGWAGMGPTALSAAPTMGYDASIFEANVAGDLTNQLSSQPSVIGMANGQVPTTDVATAASPNVTPAPAEQVLSDVQNLPAYEDPAKGFALAETAPTQGVEPAPGTMASDISGGVPDTTPRSLLNNGLSPADQPTVLDANGRLTTVPQGGGEGGTLGATNNPAAPGEGLYDPSKSSLVTGTAAPKPAGIVGADATPATTPVDAGAQITGVNAPSGGSLLNGGGGVEANISGFPKGAGPMGPSGGSLVPDSKSLFGGVLDFVQKNQMLSYGAMQAMGSFLSGATSPIPQATVDELNSRAAANQATKNLYDQQAAMLQQRMNRMNEPMPVAMRQPQGLINGGSAVTGRVG